MNVKRLRPTAGTLNTSGL